MDDLKKSFDKEPKSRKIILLSALAGLVSSFLPWWSISIDSPFGSFGGFSANGWHRFGYLTALSSIALILMWVLPKIGMKFSLPAKEDVLYKVLSIALLAGPVIWILDSSFEFSVMGVGVYLALAAGAAATYFAVIKKDKKGPEAKAEVKK